MIDNEFLLNLLQDGKWHEKEEIEVKSYAERGRRMTVHSRVAELRTTGGWIIEHRKQGGQSFYRLIGHQEVPTETVQPKNGKEQPIVAGYLFYTQGEHRNNGKLVQIVARSDQQEGETMEPMFEIEFSNGTKDVAFASELQPWFPSG